MYRARSFTYRRVIRRADQDRGRRFTAMLDRGHGSTGSPVIETRLFGYELLNGPLVDKGTAFTDEDRASFELPVLLPPNVATLDEQVSRRMQSFLQLPTDLERYVFLR